MKQSRRDFIKSAVAAMLALFVPKAKEIEAIEIEWAQGEPDENYVNGFAVADFDDETAGQTLECAISNWEVFLIQDGELLPVDSIQDAINLARPGEVTSDAIFVQPDGYE